MELPNSPQNSSPQESSRETPENGVSLFLRLWTYGGPSQPPTGVPLAETSEITELIDSIVRDSEGVIAKRQPELVEAHFDSAFSALSVGKMLQQRFLTFHRDKEPQQLVPSILIYGRKTETNSSPDSAAPEDMLANVTSAQILIAGGIYEEVKTAPGFKFNPRPVREAGESFGPEAIYELLWTDESTYGHLRRASRAGLRTVGRYQIQEELGRGAMGAVYKAYDELIGRTVALKTIAIDSSAPDREELIERLKQEAKAAGGLDHPNIITIYDVGQENDVVYLSMQFVKGTTLGALLANSGVPSLPTFLSWADQISAAVGFAHARGVIHRDLKPANLMVTDDGIIKVLDFGIAKIGNTSLTQTGLVVGTPSYMSPELISGKKTDHRADIFALGAVFYELVTREKAFRGDVTTVLYKIVHEEPVAPSLVNPAVPGGIDAVIRKALAKDLKQRFQSCEEMRKAFLEHASRLHPAPAAIVAAPAIAPKLESRSAPPVPSFLLTESAPKAKMWPKLVLAAMLAVGAVAGWAFYTRSRTGAFPPAVTNAVGAMHEVPQALHNLKPPAGQAQPPSGDHSGPTVQGDQADGSNDQKAPNNAAGQSTTAANDASSNGSVQDSTGQSASLANPPAGNSTEPSNPSRSPFSAPAQQTSQGPALVSGSAPSPAAVQPVAAKQPNLPDTTANGPVGTGAANGSTDSDAAKDDTEDSSASASKRVEKRKPQAPLTVDGFGRKDIPQLLQLADVAARRGDYRLAIYEYNLILRLDHGNAAAHKGLQLARAEQARH